MTKSRARARSQAKEERVSPSVQHGPRRRARPAGKVGPHGSWSNFVELKWVPGNGQARQALPSRHGTSPGRTGPASDPGPGVPATGAPAVHDCVVNANPRREADPRCWCRPKSNPANHFLRMRHAERCRSLSRDPVEPALPGRNSTDSGSPVPAAPADQRAQRVKAVALLIGRGSRFLF